jgi:hypothetical protein
MKIIIIDHEPFSERKNQHYHIDKFLSNGIDVEYWDVSKALAYSKHVIYTYQDNQSFVKVFHDDNLLLQAIRNIENNTTVIVLEILFRKCTFSLFKAIRKQGLKWSRINYYQNPVAVLGDKSSMGQKLKKAFDIKFLWNKLNLLFLNKDEDFSKPDLLFLTGNSRPNNNVRTISLDFFDVEEYKQLLLSKQKSLVEGAYIVFLDIMFANHPDFKRLKVNTIDEETYFTKMRSFFDKIEKLYNKPVVIASHPKANYNQEYGDRIVIKDATARLVKDSDLVITHGSLSISYALLAFRPLLYVYFDEMQRTDTLQVYYKRMVKACEKLRAGLYNADSAFNLVDGPRVDQEKYKAFLEEVYLKVSNDSRSNFEIIKDNLLSLTNE